MLEKSYSKSAYAISSVIAALALMLFALSYGFASPAYAADATASSSATASKLIAGEKGAVTVATSATSGNYKPMTLENAKGTIHLYPLFYDKQSKKCLFVLRFEFALQNGRRAHECQLEQPEGLHR